MSLLEDKLDERLRKNLANPAQITPESIASASAEVTEIIGDRDVPMYAQLDIGVYRFKLSMKLQPSETEKTVFETAMKIVRSAPSIDPDNSTTGSVIVIQRESEWA